jgi:hypothetical protein
MGLEVYLKLKLAVVGERLRRVERGLAVCIRLTMVLD